MSHKTLFAVIDKEDASMGKRLIAKKSFFIGDKLFDIVGRETTFASQYSVQISQTSHIDLPKNCKDDACYFWRYLNHSSKEANTYVRDKAIYASKNILIGEEITFDYNLNEWDMAVGFVDWQTGELVKGFKHLGIERQIERLPYVSKHIYELYQEESSD